MTTPAETVAYRTEGSNDAIIHVWCCDPDLALCGKDVSAEPEVPDGFGIDCVVCIDLEDQPCTCPIGGPS